MFKTAVSKFRNSNASSFCVESGVPLPPLSKASLKYPFDEMKVGDSFDAGEFQQSDAVRIRSAANHYGKRESKKFITRKTDDNRIRCWRVA